MSKFYNWLNEAQNNYIAIYAGRFHPFHKGHAETYQNAVREFGKNNVYVATSDKVDPPKSPFNFKEKYKIITTMFDIPRDKVVKIKNPYKPTEILQKLPENTVYIAIVGKKDAQRLLHGKYFEMYNNTIELEGYKDKGYIWIAPENSTTHNGKQVSGTMVRNIFSEAVPEEKKDLFLSLYPKWDKNIFELITNKIK